MRNLEGIAARGVAGWILLQLHRWAAEGDGLLVLQIVGVYLTGVDEDAFKLSHVHAMLSLTTAQQLVGLLQTSARISEWACVWGMMACVSIIAVVGRKHEPYKSHSFADICAFAVSLLLTTALERWLSGSGMLEAGMVYLVVFCILEVLHREPWSSAARGGTVMPAQGPLGLALATENGLVI